MSEVKTVCTSLKYFGLNENRPFVRIRLGDLEYNALIDSGANVSVINESVWKILGKTFEHLWSHSDVKIKGVHGSLQSTFGVVNLPVVYGKRRSSFSFLILSNCVEPVILGADFCREMNIKITFAPREISINNLTCQTSEITLTPESSARLQSVLGKFSDLVHDKLTKTSIMSHSIETGDAPPFRCRQYPFSPALMRELNLELDRMLADGIISPASSPWSSPVLMVRKKTGEYRFCFDGRRLNEVTIQDSYPLPRIDVLLSKLSRAKFFSSVDLKSAYWQIPLDEASKPKTAFVVHGRGQFLFERLPFGLADSGRKMQRLMDFVFGPCLEPYILCYQDDLILATDTFEKHLEMLKLVAEKLKDANLTVNLEKCKFCRSSLPFLGFVVDQQGLHPDPDKVKAMVEFPRPTTVTQVKRFIGLTSYYRRFVPHFSTISAPITALISGKRKSNEISWTEEAIEAFDRLKSCLVTAPVLVSPDFTKPFVIQTDASNYGLAAVLIQEIEGFEHPIAYASKTMNPAQKNYTTTEQEMLALLFGVEAYRSYVEGTKFKVITDHHSLLWLKNLKNPTGRLARWSLTLSQYDFTIEHRKGALNVVPDALSRAPVNLVQFQLPVKDPWYVGLKSKIVAFPEDYPLFRISEEKIFRLVNKQEPSGVNSNSWKLVLPKEFRNDALVECHDVPTAGHMGVAKTLDRIRDLYFWPNMKSDVIKYLRKCKVCAMIRSPSDAKHGLMGQRKAVAFPFQSLSIDFIGPLPRSKSGNRFILAVSDIFSKFVFLKALPKANSKSVCKFLEEQVFLIFGVPQSLICDNATYFTSNYFKTFLDEYKIQRAFYNARYHAQHNPVERVNRTVLASISAYIHENHREWDVHLSKIAQAIRLSTHQVTGKSPSFLVFGRLTPVTGDFYGPVSTDPDFLPVCLPTKDHERNIKNLVSCYPSIRDKLRLAHARNAKQYNLRRKPLAFEVGDLVWKKNFVLSNASEHFSAKLAPKFVPGIVHRKLGNLVYNIVDREGKDLGNFHVKDLKPDLTELLDE